jgi:hypothetical protein
MTEMQNPKPIDDSGKQNLSLAIGIKADTIPEYCSRSFWSFDIGICDLFVIWCLLFVILFSY